MNSTLFKVVAVILSILLLVSIPLTIHAEEIADPGSISEDSQDRIMTEEGEYETTEEMPEVSRGTSLPVQDVTETKESEPEEAAVSQSEVSEQEEAEPEEKMPTSEQIVNEAGDEKQVETTSGEEALNSGIVDGPDLGEEILNEAIDETEEASEEIKEETTNPEIIEEEAEEPEVAEAAPRMKLMAAPVLKAADTVHTEKAVNSSAVEVVKLGTTADSAYAFSLRPNSSTTIEPFGFKSGEVYRETERRFTAYVSSDSQSGNCGFWIYNAGRYHGKVVDVKGTITFKSGETPTIFFGTSGATFGCWFQNYPYFIRYDLYTKENGKEVPLKVSMSATLVDIDYYQKFAVKPNTGSIAKIQVVNTSEVYYGTNTAYPEWKYFYAGTDIDYPTSPIEEAVKAEARVLFKDTDSFTVAYSSQQYESLFPGMGMDDNIVAWQWTNEAKEAVRNGEWYDGPKHFMAFSAIAFGPYDIPTPLKTVTDADETEVTSNTITDSETFRFDICQEVPYERDEAYYYSAFVMKDTVPAGLNVTNVKILNEAGGNATSKFTVTTSGQNVTATANDTSVAGFYNQEYTMQIFCKYDASAGNAGPWKNKATVEVTRNGKKTTVTSNETTTVIPFRKITTEVVNGTITPSDTKVQIGSNKKIEYSPKSGYYLDSVTVDGKAVDITKYPASYTFSNVQADHTIKAVYVPYWKVTTEVQNGSITPSDTKIKAGEDRKIEYSPKNGYYLDSITVDGKTVDITKYPSSYDFTGIKADHTVKVVYLPYWKITTQVVNGTITPDITLIKAGENRAVGYQGKDGYFLTSVVIDGKEVDETEFPETYAFTNIQADHEIKAVYSPVPVKHIVDGKGEDIHGKLVGQGELITYKITVTNAGDFAKTAEVTDLIPEGTEFISADNGGASKDGSVTWTNVNVPAKGNTTVSFTVKASGEGSITNAAKVKMSGQTIPTNEVKNVIIPPPAKTVTDMDGNDLDHMDAECNEEIRYSITVRNTSDAEKAFTVTDQVPEHGSLARISDDGQEKDGVITWKLTLKGNTEKTVSFTILAADKESTLKNKAGMQVDGVGLESNEVTTFVQPDPVKTVTKDEKDVNGSVFFRGEDNTIVYTITWKNIADHAVEYTLTDEVPKGMEITEVSGEGNVKKRKVTWTGEAKPGEEVKQTITAMTQDGSKENAYHNNAKLVSSRTKRNTNEVVTYLTDPPKKEVVDAEGADMHMQVIGRNTEYQYRITFHNPKEEACEFLITDEVPEGLEIVSADHEEKIDGQKITWNITLQPDEKVTLTVVFTAPDEVAGKRIDNKANVTAKQYLHDTNTVTNYVIVDPTKAVTDKDGKDIHRMLRKEGDALTYVITVKNPADISQDVKVTDVLPKDVKFEKADNGGTHNDGIVTWQLTMAPEAEIHLTVSVKILPEAKGTILKNKANAAFNATEKDTNEVKNPVLPDPVKTVTDKDGKDIDGHPVHQGQVITYTITQENPADEEKTFIITDKVPEHTKWEQISDGGKEEKGVITWTVKIPAWEKASVRFTAVPQEKGVVFRNTASVTADGKELKTNTTVNAVPKDPVKMGTTGKDTDVNGKTVFAGSEITYDITVNNPFDFEKEFKVTDMLPEGTEFISADNGGTHQDGIVTWNLKMKKNETRTIHVAVKVKEDVQNARLVNQAIQTADSWKKETNEVVTFVPYRPKKEVLNEKGESYNEGIVKAGDILTYRITVYNPKDAQEAEYVIRDYYPADKVEFLNATDDGKESTEDDGRHKVRFEVKVPSGEAKEVSFRVRVKETTEAIRNSAETELNSRMMPTGEVVNYPLTAPEKYVFYNGKEWNKQEVPAGLLLEYRIKVHNPAEHEKTIKITDVLDPNLDYVKSSHNGKCEGNIVTWNVTHAENTDLFVTVTARVKPDTPDGTTIRNKAGMLIEGKEAETNEVENPIKRITLTPFMHAVNTVRTGDTGRLLLSGGITALAAIGIALWFFNNRGGRGGRRRRMTA